MNESKFSLRAGIGGFVFSMICFFIFAVISTLIGCQPVEKDVRDALAANKGYLVAAIQKHSVECMSNRNISVCEIIVKDAHAQGAAVTAFESYCQIPAHTMDNPSLKCKPVRSLSGALTSALKNLNALSADIKAAAQ